jgi:hypothetical protein
LHLSAICDTVISKIGGDKLLIDKSTWQPTDKRTVNTVEIDDNIADIICELNRKGYYTRACCEGHESDKGLYHYILFATPVPSVPYGARTNKGRTLVEYKYHMGRHKFKDGDMALQKRFKKRILSWERNWVKRLRGG